MQKQRLEYLDVARGIAMIAIVLGHLGSALINRVVYTFHLPMFYFISGYFFDERATLHAFVGKKARQLLVPYYVTCLVYCLATIVQNLIHGFPWSAGLGDNLLATLCGSGASYETPLHIPRIGALWFLWALFWALVLLKLLLKCRRFLRVTAVAAIFALSCWSEPRLGLPLSLQPAGCALLFIYLGYLLRKLMPVLKTARVSGAIRIAGAMLALAMWIWFICTFTDFWLVTADVGKGLPDIVGSACGCIVIVLLSKLINRYLHRLSAALVFYGRYSLLFLSIHYIEMRRLSYRFLYPKLLALAGLADSEGLFMAYRAVVELSLITVSMLVLYRICAVRRVFGYPPIQTKRASRAHQ